MTAEPPTIAKKYRCAYQTQPGVICGRWHTGFHESYNGKTYYTSTKCREHSLPWHRSIRAQGIAWMRELARRAHLEGDRQALEDLRWEQAQERRMIKERSEMVRRGLMRGTP